MKQYFREFSYKTVCIHESQTENFQVRIKDILNIVDSIVWIIHFFPSIRELYHESKRTKNRNYTKLL